MFYQNKYVTYLRQDDKIIYLRISWPAIYSMTRKELQSKEIVQLIDSHPNTLLALYIAVANDREDIIEYFHNVEEKGHTFTVGPHGLARRYYYPQQMNPVIDIEQQRLLFIGRSYVKRTDFDELITEYAVKLESIFALKFLINKGTYMGWYVLLYKE